MAARNTVVLTISMLGVQHGLWCRPCALSTGVAAWYVITATGALREKRKCIECDGTDVEGDPRAEWLS